MMPDPMTPEEARKRLRERGQVPNRFLTAILATTEALAALVTWPALLAAGERAGKVKRTHRCTGCDNPPTRNHVGYESWRLTDPEAAS